MGSAPGVINTASGGKAARSILAFLCLLFFSFTASGFSGKGTSVDEWSGYLARSLSPTPAYALDVPPLRGYVNDYAAMISPPAKAKLQTELKTFEQSDSTQVVILTVPSLQGEALEDYSIKVVEAWKIGQKGKDNGVLILVANKEHRIRIEVGRGLEGRLTDLTAGQIVDLVIKPRFKRGDFDGGFTAGVSAVIDATRGEFKAEPGKVRGKGRSYTPFLALILVGGVALLFLGSFSRIMGAIGGALGLPALVYFTLLPLGLIPLIVLGLVGVGIGIVLPLLFSGGGPGGGGWPFWGGFFGPWGGGGGGNGGGDDGGGFDGGGGGDFGGGGASGDW